MALYGAAAPGAPTTEESGNGAVGASVLAGEVRDQMICHIV